MIKPRQSSPLLAWCTNKDDMLQNKSPTIKCLTLVGDLSNFYADGDHRLHENQQRKKKKRPTNRQPHASRLCFLCREIKDQY